ncbi:MAG: hypothetical protein A3E84_02260 [Gammaproteobacteria bacterium RIFCSPHIGHO2_12_FULL_42_13]|nr:MAG: hypothetical protein A3E84_02260 [Gammaproteobacteria bacterium RIFCSPHIGHO2_12_FULL_42_13]
MSWFTDALTSIYASSGVAIAHQNVQRFENAIDRLCNFDSPLGVKLHMLSYVERWLNRDSLALLSPVLSSTTPTMPLDPVKIKIQWIGSFCVAQKMCEDSPLLVKSIAALFSCTTPEVSQMERACLKVLEFNTTITAEDIQSILGRCSDPALRQLRRELLDSPLWEKYQKYKSYEAIERGMREGLLMEARESRTLAGKPIDPARNINDQVRERIAESVHIPRSENWEDNISFYVAIDAVLRAKSLPHLGMLESTAAVIPGITLYQRPASDEVVAGERPLAPSADKKKP